MDSHRRVLLLSLLFYPRYPETSVKGQSLSPASATALSAAILSRWWATLRAPTLRAAATLSRLGCLTAATLSGLSCLPTATLITTSLVCLSYLTCLPTAILTCLGTTTLFRLGCLNAAILSGSSAPRPAWPCPAFRTACPARP